MMSTPVYELIVYTVREDKLENYAGVRGQVFQYLSTLDGYREGSTFRSLKQPNLFVDYITWTSLGQAKAAAQNWRSSAVSSEVAPYVEAVQLHDYSAPVADGERGAFDHLAPEDIVEISVFQLNPEKRGDLQAARPPLFDQILAYDGCKFTRASESTEDPLRYTDLLWWSDLETATRVAEAIHQVEACATFMGSIAEDLFFDHLVIFA